MPNHSRSSTRRNFLTSVSSTAAAVSTLAFPAVVTARRTDPLWPGQQSDTVIGKDGYQFRTDHRLLQLPQKFRWDFTHNLSLDSVGNIYVIHEGNRKRKDHPSIFVFGPEGKFIRAFGGQFQGGGHGIDVRKEGNEEFLYIAAYQQVKALAKLTLTGEVVWYKRAPTESGVYKEKMALSFDKGFRRSNFLPTNFAFLDDGGFLLADGYGSYYIHQYDKDAKWVRCFGGPGEKDGQFSLSHGIWVDDRPGREQPSLLVTDRNRDRMQRLTLDGKYIETLENFKKPCTIDTWKNEAVISEYAGIVTILDEQNKVVARFDDGFNRKPQVKKLRDKPKEWIDGHFIAPHDACYDPDGNIYVAERIRSGRITKMTRIT